MLIGAFRQNHSEMHFDCKNLIDIRQVGPYDQEVVLIDVKLKEELDKKNKKTISGSVKVGYIAIDIDFMDILTVFKVMKDCFKYQKHKN